MKNYSIVGLHWGLYATQDPALLRECHTQLTKLVEQGLGLLLVSERLGLEEVPAGLQRLAESNTKLSQAKKQQKKTNC